MRGLVGALELIQHVWTSRTMSVVVVAYGVSLQFVQNMLPFFRITAHGTTLRISSRCHGSWFCHVRGIMNTLSLHMERCAVPQFYMVREHAYSYAAILANSSCYNSMCV